MIRLGLILGIAALSGCALAEPVGIGRESVERPISEPHHEEITSLLAQIRTADSATARALGDRLLTEYGHASVPWIREGILSGSTPYNQYCIRMLLQLDDDGALPWIAAATTPEHRMPLRLAAIDALAELSQEYAHAVLVDLAQTDRKPEIQLAAIDAIRKQRAGGRSRNLLRILVGAEWNEVRIASIHALAAANDPTTARELVKWWENHPNLNDDLSRACLTAAAVIDHESTTAWMMRVAETLRVEETVGVVSTAMRRRRLQALAPWIVARLEYVDWPTFRMVHRDLRLVVRGEMNADLHDIAMGDRLPLTRSWQQLFADESAED
jgi:HEAT repeat protein